MIRFRHAGLPAIVMVALAACNAPAPGTAAPTAAAPADSQDCVTIAKGFYEFDGTHLLAVPADRVRGAASGWQGEVQSSFSGLGFPWMGLSVRDRIATLTGTAPSAEAKTAALEAGEAAIAAHPEAGAAGLLIVDGISVEGGERGVGASLAELADTGASLESCQQAFVDTMEGRNIQFESGNANISPVSARLLDAVTGVATLCSAFGIEIGGHTDSRGADDYNLQLSQARADAVRDYLLGKGVTADVLLSVGYGETRPLDPALTPEAYDRNRRTEFKVIAR
jgi:outer membrane protein OmpA-like peptidoglycan-associated protein